MDDPTLKAILVPVVLLIVTESVRYYFTQRTTRAAETSKQQEKTAEGDTSVRLKEIDDAAALRKEMREIEKSLRADLKAAQDDAISWRNRYYDELVSRTEFERLKSELADLKQKYTAALLERDDLKRTITQYQQERRPQ